MNSHYQIRSNRTYTITNAQEDIEYQGKQIDSVQSEVKSLSEAVSQMHSDEYRALHLCSIFKRRVDILETLILKMLPPEERKLLTHIVTNELRGIKQSEALA